MMHLCPHLLTVSHEAHFLYWQTEFPLPDWRTAA